MSLGNARKIGPSVSVLYQDSKKPQNLTVANSIMCDNPGAMQGVFVSTTACASVCVCACLRKLDAISYEIACVSGAVCVCVNQCARPCWCHCLYMCTYVSRYFQACLCVRCVSPRAWASPYGLRGAGALRDAIWLCPYITNPLKIFFYQALGDQMNARMTLPHSFRAISAEPR